MITIYHNPACSNSRGALAILEEAGAEIRIVDYLKTPLTKAELETLARQLKQTAGTDGVDAAAGKRQLDRLIELRAQAELAHAL